MTDEPSPDVDVSRFLRAVGAEVCRRVAPAFPDIRAHVGHDLRAEAQRRWGEPLPSLDWVAFSFPGVDMWDLHVGVVAAVDGSSATCQVGVHFTPAVAGRVERVIAEIDWTSRLGQAGERAESRAVGEVQQRDAASALALGDFPTAVKRFADRAVRYYSVVAPLVRDRGSA